MFPSCHPPTNTTLGIGRSTATLPRAERATGERQMSRWFFAPIVASEKTTVNRIKDYISGQEILATPEETQAVQVFSRRLVQDFGYPKSHIRTRPQYRVRQRPSDEAKGYPVDIAVFTGPQHGESTEYIIVECKKKNRNEGRKQLEIYLRMSDAQLGVWFNGDQHLYLRKWYASGGLIRYDEIPSLPRFGQRVEDIGLYKRRELSPPSNLRAVFKDIRNHLAGMTTGITRDEPLAREIINILFCKLHDETMKEPDEQVDFRVGIDEKPQEVKTRISRLFQAVKEEVPEVFEAGDKIGLDPKSLVYVVGELQNYCIMDASRDAIGDAFEVFIGPALRGSEGQFFTPRNVVQLLVSIVDPKPGEMIVDPACGSGGFLIESLAHVWNQMDEHGKRRRWTSSVLATRKTRTATECFRGIDKDAFLARVTKAYMALVGDGRGGIFCENSLTKPSTWKPVMREKIILGTFDVVLTNPPFGKKIVVKGKETLQQYDLGYKWAKNKESGTWERTSTLREKEKPQLLFIERALQLLKPGGRMGIILPEAIFGMPTYRYVVEWLLSHTQVMAIVGMPEELFKTSGKIGTHAKVVALVVRKLEEGESPQGDYKIFMAEAKWCGHDSRGNPTRVTLADGTEKVLDDVPEIAARYKELRSEIET